ncbi:MerR family transcriptional regulator [Terracoccus luteus]|uniref:MerR family transcriptional regulator n=1 Tax=Terracoccus luteus TaxID=53356 RepID=UPI001B85CBBE|nr:MerR family transcriptional regulator [Terracoccus luteus]
MTGRTLQVGTTVEPLTVGQVAQRFGVTVRTLHHYDEIGLLVPSGRTAAGYRLYTGDDLARLQQVVVYRRLELPLDRIAELLDGGEDAAEHLRRQRATVMSRLGELTELVAAIDRALEREMTDTPATTDDLKELFGDGFKDEYQQEAQERWGETDQWRQSQARTSRYTKADWAQVKQEADAVNAAFVTAKRSGVPADGDAAMDAAEAHRRHIEERFYDVSHAWHRNLAELYVGDPRFTATFEQLEPGLAQYVHDAIDANSTRHGA